MRYFSIVQFVIYFTYVSLISGTLTGRVTIKKTGEPLAGANVYLKETTVGTATDEDGLYFIRVDDGTYDVICDYIGYATITQTVDISGETRIDFTLTEFLFSKTIEVIAERARDRETPVAFTNIGKIEIINSLGSQDIPMVLNASPSVYSTMQGGGAGDARINVRGFNQNNIAIMVNGVPINDMENGWVYWSNWDGLGDASQSIQMQRGLTAVNLATPSIGGTMNIITDPTAQNMGFSLKQEIGSGNFFKTTFSASSGQIGDKFAVNTTLVKKSGDGIIDGTWTDAWAYYFGVSWNVNEENRLELYALGAPQRHGHNLYRQNIAVYSHDFAKDLNDYEPVAFNANKEASSGRLFNQTFNKLRNQKSYNGKQAVGDLTFDRYAKGFLNERENFYHKPLVNLNWYTTMSDKLGLSTIFYYSGGIGGGTGRAGSIVWDFLTEPTPIPDWDATILNNQMSETGSVGILRNSRNNQNTIGLISKLNWNPIKNLNTTIGIDWRTAEIEHYYEVRDLLGGDYYIPDSLDRSEFWGTDAVYLGLGDKFNYYNTNTVDWIGGFLQGEYLMDDWTAYATLGFSKVTYKYVDNFKAAEVYTIDNALDTTMIGQPNLNSGKFKLESDPDYGFQIKAGTMYRITTIGDIYANVGYVEKVPIFDNVIDDNNGIFSNNPKPERFTSFELGMNWKLLDNQLILKSNFYYTLWQDRALPIQVQTTDDDWDILFLTGLDQLHLGIEFAAAYQPMPLFRFDLAGSIARWEHVSDAKGQYRAVDSDVLTTRTYLIGANGLKIGDAPQTQIAIAGTIFPAKGTELTVSYRYYDDFYAAWNAQDRIVFNGDIPDRVQSWRVPAYGLFDFHGFYILPIDLFGIRFRISAHVFNLLDEIYISDAVDNEQGIGYDYDHDADDAGVYMGLPRTFNVGLTIIY
jgi:iron complex outermembrane receptor protein